MVLVYLYLIRHAERDKDSSKVDCEQPLSPKGRLQAEALAIRLKTEKAPTLVLTSEWVHAEETACYQGSIVFFCLNNNY